LNQPIYQLNQLNGTVVAWKIYANDSAGNENVTNEMTFEVKPTYLLVNLTFPSPLTYTQTNPYLVVQNNTFWVNASVKCYSEGEDGNCGNILGSPRYNKTDIEPNEIINGTEDVPFYVISQWKFKRLITINNTLNSNDLTDYQVLVNLDTQSLISQGKMRNDCGDIRFTDSTQLNYWIESGCNTTSTKIWVKVPFIPASSTGTIYIYYGNPNATSLSNGTNTFLAFSLEFDGPFGGRTSHGGSSHTCALLSDGTAKCWGYNGYGQLGDGTTTSSNTPVSVSGLTNAVAIAAGFYHTCALLSDGTAKCWGRNDNGQLGDGTTTNRNTPVSVSGLTNAVAIAAGGYHYNGYGQLGDGTTTNRNTPVSVSGLTNAVAIAAGGYHTCALLSDGTAKCWGYNGYGQLGDGTTTNRNTPVSVSGLTNAVAIAAGGSHTCALLSDGTAKCWGYNGFGQLGDGTTTNRNTPVSVSGLTNAVAIWLSYLCIKRWYC